MAWPFCRAATGYEAERKKITKRRRGMQLLHPAAHRTIQGFGGCVCAGSFCIPRRTGKLKALAVVHAQAASASRGAQGQNSKRQQILSVTGHPEAFSDCAELFAADPALFKGDLLGTGDGAPALLLDLPDGAAGLEQAVGVAGVEPDGVRVKRDDRRRASPVWRTPPPDCHRNKAPAH